MHCPHCSQEPPHDPFVCWSCGRRLATYLDEPFGPGTAIQDGVVAAETAPRPTATSSPGVAVGPRPAIPRPLDPSENGRRPDDAWPSGADDRATRGPVWIALWLLAGGFVATILATRSVPVALTFFVLAAFAAWRLRSLSSSVFTALFVGAALLGWFVSPTVENARRLASRPVVRATPTPVRGADGLPAATPTLIGYYQTATATAIVAEQAPRLARGRARWLRGDPGAALTELDLAVAQAPDLADARNLRALARSAAGDYQGALADAERAVALQPSSPAYLDTRGYARLKVGQYRLAHDDYLSALQRSSAERQPASLLGRGLALYGLGQETEARAALLEGLRIAADTAPDPQLVDLEASARQTLERPGGAPPSPSPAATAGSVATPVTTPGPASASPVPAATGLPGPDVTPQRSAP